MWPIWIIVFTLLFFKTVEEIIKICLKKNRKAVRISFPCSNVFLKHYASQLCVTPQYLIADSIFLFSPLCNQYLIAVPDYCRRFCTFVHLLCMQCLALKREMLTFQEVCMYLEEVVVSRIKRYLEAPKKRGQWKSVEHASSAPLFITGKISYLIYKTIKQGKIWWKLLFFTFSWETSHHEI